MPNSHDKDQCPLSAVDLRLADAHKLWHQANDSYFSPDDFRLASQSVIQTLRTVTFVLQANKRLIADFDRWYAKEQEIMRGDPLLKWLVEARNSIEKKGDLRRTSFVKAEIIASHLEDQYPKIDIEARLFENFDMLFARIPGSFLKDHVFVNGILRIEREWRHDSLPNWEIVDLLAELYGKVSMVVHRAHLQAGLLPPRLKDQSASDVFDYPDQLKGRLPCMIGHNCLRQIQIHLGDGSSLSLRSEKVSLSRDAQDRTLKRYGLLPTSVAPNDSEPDEAELSRFFEMARTVFLRDGYHLPFVFLIAAGKRVELLCVPARDRQEKYIHSRNIAVQAQRMGADALIMINEAWYSEMTPDKFVLPQDSPNRKEFLTALRLDRTGKSLAFHAQIVREGSMLSLGPTTEHRDHKSFFFAPVLKLWGLAIPQMPSEYDSCEPT